ncbi:MAG: hypothetical protein ACKOC5_19230 [Chloroflexota bacterium]
MPGALFSLLAPGIGVTTCVLREEALKLPPVIGQFIHLPGSPFSNLTFLTPAEAMDSLCARMLLEYMLKLSGQRGALRMLAEVDADSLVFDALRKLGFATYTRQRIWQITGMAPNPGGDLTWRPAGPQDELAIRILYNNLVPGLVQQVEPFSSRRPKGMVYYGQGDLLAYVELKYGHRGIWAQPFVHPGAENMPELFIDMVSKIPGRRTRPVYLCVRSYQAWLEAAVEDLGAESGPRQAVMARHLAVQQKTRAAVAMPALEGGQPEITAPVRVETK